MIVSVMLLTLCVADVEPTILPSELGVAPQIRGIPEDAPVHWLMPRDGKWIRNEGEPFFSGTFLPSPLDAHVGRLLRAIQQYPAVCQSHIDGVRKLEATKADGMVAVERAKCISDSIRAENKSDGWPGWLVAVGVIGAGIAGGVVGWNLRK